MPVFFYMQLYEYESGILYRLFDIASTKIGTIPIIKPGKTSKIMAATFGLRAIVDSAHIFFVLVTVISFADETLIEDSGFILYMPVSDLTFIVFAELLYMVVW